VRSSYPRLAVLVGLLVLLPALGAPAVSAGTPPVLSKMHAHFVESEKATHYTVEVTGTTATPAYNWALQPPMDDPTCNKFEVTSAGNEAIWHHADTDGCHHNGIQHDGTIVVVVLVAGWKCTATYFGTLDGDGPQPEPCTSTATPPNTCKCSKIKMTTSPENFTADHTFEFAINWTITCTGGEGTCRGEIQMLPPVEVRGVLHYDTDLRIVSGKTVVEKGKKTERREIKCAGRCGRKSTGTFHVVGKSADDLRLRARRGKTFLFKFKLLCDDKQPVQDEMTIVFDKRGFLDRKKSDFGK
jgi:hypothetical protein